jgi:putative spermidine/putrescine transport system substrate-binding protein
MSRAGTNFLGFGVLALGVLGASAALAQEVTIATSGGIVQEAGSKFLWGPAAKTLGLTVREETFDDGYQALRLQKDAGAVTYDIVQVPTFQAEIGLKEGLFGPLDYGVIDAGEFPKSAAGPACIGFLASSWVMAWNTNVYKDNPPKNWADFWDTKKFPGRRAMHNDSEAQMEIALMADGVAPKDVYTVLASPEGIKRAVDKLAELKPNIAVWWSSGSQSQQIMKDNEVDLAVMWNGRSEGLKEGGAPVDYTFNQGILSQDCWAVPANAPHKAEATKLLNEMSKPEPQANFAVMVKYGPLNMKAYTTGLISDQIAAKFPSYPANADKMVVQSGEWWAKNTAAADTAFDDMMNQ